MNTEAIVNTANDNPTVGAGCDTAIYNAAGFDELLAYRKEKIGYVPQGEVFITPAFGLPARYIIHAVSPCFNDKQGDEGEKEELLRACYRKSLMLAKEYGIKSITFPLISAGGYGCPKEISMRIGLDEINAFLMDNDMEIYLLVFGDSETELGTKIYPGLEEYINRNYVEEKCREEYDVVKEEASYNSKSRKGLFGHREKDLSLRGRLQSAKASRPDKQNHLASGMFSQAALTPQVENYSFDEKHETKLEERMSHLTDTFSQYLIYLIESKNMQNSEVYKRAIVDKKIFSKIKNNVNYHPQKITALCLCMGARLNMDETKDLLARAGYALSPCDKTDIIFSYFIENEIYDMIELDIQLEEHGLPCIIS